MYKVLKAAMITNPLVSIVLPIYNVEKYLEECLESITGQTLKNIEIICIIDGSEDASLSIALKFAAQDTRITVVEQSNQGISVARNNGMELAKGKYLYFCDSDDYIDSDTLKLTVERCEQYDLDMVLFSTEAFAESGEEGEAFEAKRRFYHRNHDYPEIYSGEKLFEAMRLNHEYLMPVWLYIVNRDFLTRTGIKFIPGVNHEDNAFTFEVLLSASRAGFINRQFCHHRFRAGSVMTSMSKLRSAYDYFKCYMHMLDYINGRELSGTVKEQAYLQLEATINNAKKGYALADGSNLEELGPMNLWEKLLFQQLVINSCQIKQELKECWSRRREIWQQLQEANAARKKNWDALMEANAGRKRNWDALQETRTQLKQKNEEIKKLEEKVRIVQSKLEAMEKSYKENLAENEG